MINKQHAFEVHQNIENCINMLEYAVNESMDFLISEMKEGSQVLINDEIAYFILVDKEGKKVVFANECCTMLKVFGISKFLKLVVDEYISKPTGQNLKSSTLKEMKKVYNLTK